MSSENTANDDFEQFLTLLDEFLYSQGWYTNGWYIREKCHTYEEIENYLEEHCYSRAKSKEVVETIRQKVKGHMTDSEQKSIWDKGWQAFWSGSKQDTCPDYPEQEQRDEWMSGWLTAQSSEASIAPTEIS